MPFASRTEAGQRLAQALRKYMGKDVVILAIPRGGLVIGFEIARALGAPLDIAVSKKIGFPGQPEYAIGAVGPHGKVILNERVINQSGIPQDYIDKEVAALKDKIEKRYEEYRGERKAVPLKDKIVILTDDGIATGHTMQVLLDLLRQEKPKKLIAAVPVGPQDNVAKLRDHADEVVCLETPPGFHAIGQFYRDFTQVEDAEAIDLLRRANEHKNKGGQ